MTDRQKILATLTKGNRNKTGVQKLQLRMLASEIKTAKEGPEIVHGGRDE